MIKTLTYFRLVDRAAFSPAETRELLSLGMSAYCAAVRSGQLRIVRIGGLPRIPAADVAALVSVESGLTHDPDSTTE